MGIKRTIKELAEKLTGARIYRPLPRGIDPLHDIAHHLARLRVRTIFDVGANLGQTAEVYVEKFPGATIYCFEPVDETFRQLQQNLKGHANIEFCRLALGARQGDGQMVVTGQSDLNHLVDKADGMAETADSRVEQVPLDTVDGFCRTRKIERIELLKIDTEGGDLDVLHGADGMLRAQKVDVVEVEAGMNRLNTRHVPLDVFVKFFEEREYFLFGIYEQMHEWPTNSPNLRRTNPLFISARTIGEHRG